MYVIHTCTYVGRYVCLCVCTYVFALLQYCGVYNRHAYATFLVSSDVKVKPKAFNGNYKSNFTLRALSEVD